MPGDCVVIAEKHVILNSARFFLEYNEEFGVMTQSPGTKVGLFSDFLDQIASEVSLGY